MSWRKENCGVLGQVQEKFTSGSEVGGWGPFYLFFLNFVSQGGKESDKDLRSLKHRWIKPIIEKIVPRWSENTFSFLGDKKKGNKTMMWF